MRLGSFIAGGLFGVAMVYMLNSRMTTRLMSQMGSSSMGTSKSGGTSSSSNSNYASSDDSQSDIDGLRKFKQMIKQDSQLKQTIMEIINQDEQASSSTPTNASKH